MHLYLFTIHLNPHTRSLHLARTFLYGAESIAHLLWWKDLPSPLTALMHLGLFAFSTDVIF